LKKKHAGEEVEFYRIRELLGRKVRIVHQTTASPASSTLSAFFKRDSATEIAEESLTEFIISSGLPVDVTETPAFRKFVNAVRDVPSVISFKIGREKTKDNILKIHARHWADFSSFVQSDACMAWSVVFDCWDWTRKHKFIGATAIAIAVDEDGLKLEKYPIIFRCLVGNDSYDSVEEVYVPIKTLSSGEDIAEIVICELAKHKVPFTKFVGGKSDGAPNAVASVKNIDRHAVARKQFAAAVTLGENRSPIAITEPRCFVHCLGLAVKGALGYLTHTENSVIPKKPKDETLALLKKVRNVANKLSDSKTWAILEGLSKAHSLQRMRAIHVDMEVRWFSYFEMLDALLGSFESYQVIAESPMGGMVGLETFNAEELTALYEIRELMRPIVKATSFMETTQFPITGTVLPMIAVVLNQYGIL
jgi:hypothetical protein